MTDEKMRAALERMVAAWDELPGGRHYGPKVIASWLETHMTPAIHRARQALATPTDQPATGDGAEDVVERLMDEAYQSADCPAGGPYALSWEQAKYMVRAALTSRAVVPGMVMVPREPTEAMIEAAMARWGSNAKNSPLTAKARAEIYRAMIAAVPTPEGE